MSGVGLTAPRTYGPISLRIGFCACTGFCRIFKTHCWYEHCPKGTRMSTSPFWMNLRGYTIIQLCRSAHLGTSGIGVSTLPNAAVSWKL